MSPGQSKLPSDSIKVVPGRSKLRVESSNPVARENPVPRPSKVKPIAPEEVIKLHSGVSKVPVPPASESSRPYKHARPTFQSRLKPVPPTFESQRREPARVSFESRRREPARVTFEGSRPVPARRAPEARRHVPARPTYKPPRHVSARPTFKPPRHVQARPTFKPPRYVPARPAPGFRKEIVCGLRAASSMDTGTVRKRTNPPRTVELPPPSPRALQIPSRVQQQATSDATTHTIEETVLEVSDEAKDHGPKETCRRSTSEERITELLLYRPALLPTWKGRIVDSARLPEFNCQFCANPASNIRMKALRLSKSMPIFLDVELVPTGHILNDLLGRIPRISDVELYFFLDKKETERSKREHAHLFEAMATRNAMIKANVNGTELLIFSSTLLDKTSQFFIKKQNKTENYLWGFFLHNKNSRSHVPRTFYQDDGHVVDMDVDPEDQTPGGLTLQPIAESQIASSSLVGKIWTPPPPPYYSRPYGSYGERPYWSYNR